MKQNETGLSLRLGILLFGVALSCGWGCTSDANSMNGTGGDTSTGGGGSSTGGVGGSSGNSDTTTGGGGSTSVGGAGAGGNGGNTMTGGSGGSGGSASLTEPTMLSETGLYTDTAAGTLAPGVMKYAPQFALWSDGATKNRWAYIPPGTKITTSDMDFWVYPVGTKFWKEFTRNDANGHPVRVETRLLWKRVAGAAGWFMMAFQWNADQTDAAATPDGVQNASGTQHDIPSKENCSTCHRNMSDRVIGFSAIQLSHPKADADDITLSDLTAMNLLSAPPAGEFTVPGNQVDKDALGYLHANCGLCHNDRSNVFATKLNDMNLWLHVAPNSNCPSCGDIASVQTTGTYLGLVNKDTKKGNILGATKRIVPGDPIHSAVYQVMNTRDVVQGVTGADASVDGGMVVAVQMPPLASELVDPVGLAKIMAWINQVQ